MHWKPRKNLKKYGISAEVWDARWVTPLNYEPLVAKRTGRVVLASDACERGSFCHTMASTINQLAFGYLDAPPVVIGARNWISPCAEMEPDYFPQPSWFIDAIHENILPLDGHEVSTGKLVQNVSLVPGCLRILFMRLSGYRTRARHNPTDSACSVQAPFFV